MTSISSRAIANSTPAPQPQEKAPRVCEKCGQDLPQPRNESRHKLFFAILKPAYKHWPHTAPWQATDLEDFRVKILIEIGWCVEETLKFSGGSKEQMLAAFSAWVSMPRKKPLTKFASIDGGMRGWSAKSIAWTPSCPEAKFKTILSDTIEFIEGVIGVSVADLRRESESEA